VVTGMYAELSSGLEPPEMPCLCFCSVPITVKSWPSMTTSLPRLFSADSEKEFALCRIQQHHRRAVLCIHFIEEAAARNFQSKISPIEVDSLQNHVFRAIGAAADVFCAGTELRLKDAHGGRSCLDVWQQGNIVRPLGWSSLRVNHSLGGRESEAMESGSDDRVGTQSRIPPSTFSLSPLMIDVTVMTVVMPMTIPRTVSADRSLFFLSVSRARRISSRSLSIPSLRMRTRRGSPAGRGKVFSKVAMNSLFYSERNASTGSSLAALDAGYVPKKSPTLKATSAADHRPQLHGARERKYHVIALATSTPHKPQ